MKIFCDAVHVIENSSRVSFAFQDIVVYGLAVCITGENLLFLMTKAIFRDIP